VARACAHHRRPRPAPFAHFVDEPGPFGDRHEHARAATYVPCRLFLSAPGFKPKPPAAGACLPGLVLDVELLTLDGGLISFSMPVRPAPPAAGGVVFRGSAWLHAGIRLIAAMPSRSAPPCSDSASSSRSDPGPCRPASPISLVRRTILTHWTGAEIETQPPSLGGKATCASAPQGATSPACCMLHQLTANAFVACSE